MLNSLLLCSLAQLPEPTFGDGIVMSIAEVRARPTSGDEWKNLLSWASRFEPVDMSNPDSHGDVVALAKAMVGVRLRDRAMLGDARDMILAGIGTEAGALEALAPARNLPPVIVAWYDLLLKAPVSYPVVSIEQYRRFKAWVEYMIDETTIWDNRSLVSTFLRRPNNWGTNAGFALIAARVALRREQEIVEHAKVFYGWVGNRSMYDDFDFDGNQWHPDPKDRRPINPVDSYIPDRVGHAFRPMDGGLPDELRRDVSYDNDTEEEPFYWPPPEQNYCWGSMQGAVMQAIVLGRLGYDVWRWESRALKRASDWLHTYPDRDPYDNDPPGYPADGDDEQIPHVLNKFYANVLEVPYPVETPASPMKNFIGLDWLY